MQLSLYNQILITKIIRNVWQTVRRLEVSGVERFRTITEKNKAIIFPRGPWRPHRTVYTRLRWGKRCHKSFINFVFECSEVFAKKLMIDLSVTFNWLDWSFWCEEIFQAWDKGGNITKLHAPGQHRKCWWDKNYLTCFNRWDWYCLLHLQMTHKIRYLFFKITHFLRKGKDQISQGQFKLIAKGRNIRRIVWYNTWCLVASASLSLSSIFLNFSWYNFWFSSKHLLNWKQKWQNWNQFTHPLYFSSHFLIL